MLQGNVVDFFQLNIQDLKIFGKTFYSWPIFNVADIAVTAGFIMILIGYRKIFRKREIEGQPQPLSDSQIFDSKLPDENITLQPDNPESPSNQIGKTL